MIILHESGMRFTFADGVRVIKFDDTLFYRDLYNKLPGAKGVDFISFDKSYVSFIEIKNCQGDEGNNRWRIAPDNHKKLATHTSYPISNRDSLDIEVAKKVAMTLSALSGAGSFGTLKKSTGELLDFYREIY